MNSLGQLRYLLPIAVGALWVAEMAAAGAAVRRAELTTAGKANYVIVVAADSSTAERFAAEELARYVRAMSGAELETVEPTASRPRRIVFGKGETQGKKFGTETYALVIKGGDVILAADSDRARLFAVYDLLE